MLKNSRSFESWMREVDVQCWRRGGCSAGDLPDANYREWFASGLSAKSAACRALKNAGEF